MSNSGIYLGAMSITTVDTPKMVNFYETVFKTRLHPQEMGRFVLYRGAVGNLNITLAPNELMGIRAEQSKHHLSFIVPNLEEYLRLVKRAGGRQTQDIDFDNLEKYCEIADPDGNPIELVEMLTELEQAEQPFNTPF